MNCTPSQLSNVNIPQFKDNRQPGEQRTIFHFVCKRGAKNVKKLVLRMIKCVFYKEKLDPIDIAYGENTFIILKSSFS